MKNRVEAFKALIFVRSSYFINIIHCVLKTVQRTLMVLMLVLHTPHYFMSLPVPEKLPLLSGYLTAYMCGCSPLLLPPLPLASLPDGYIDSLHGNYTM